MYRLGRIVDVNPATYTATVVFLGGSGYAADVPWSSSSLSAYRGAGSVHLPSIDSYCTVQMNYVGGVANPIIVSNSPKIGAKSLFKSSEIFGTEEGGTHSDASSSSKSVDYRTDRPKDMLPGDHFLTGELGEAVGVGVGGIAMLRASELCQILALQQEDLLRTIARNQQNFSDMGESEVSNVEGEIFYHEYGSNTEKESRHEKFRLRVNKMKGSGKKPTSGSTDMPETENLYFIQVNQILNPDEPEKEVPMAEICVDIDGGLLVRSGGEIKSEIVQSTVDGFSALTGGIAGEPSPVTGTHSGTETKNQDKYDNGGAEVHSVIHQTKTGDIHIQDTNGSSIDLQKGNISVKCDKTFHLVCSEFKAESETTIWTNTKTVNWAQGKSSIFQGKNITHDFQNDVRNAKNINDNGTVNHN